MFFEKKKKKILKEKREKAEKECKKRLEQLKEEYPLGTIYTHTLNRDVAISGHSLIFNYYYVEFNILIPMEPKFFIRVEWFDSHNNLIKQEYNLEHFKELFRIK